ncbi:DUF3114 domain-containing protein [Streptococcus chenjunshii]|uniref:DUF3114 domain-containing protein n=1 Tax=Streptococcus chenjunshii TaxID=2173853 RepID=A0A372KK99_9STRE|nr:DUF3114 domain-containing protein [Streptococcus chenjunshii]AXQ79086.1 DUF3114 domain-containing protein [Streptococcus chenjunshii]RFU51282.1 DUF3114 domain-containing protein [Streptococcus chenjunshii]RFU52334.1 DUF3114 domain-containing protein [Streptococcus chenjunshii]
MLIGDQEFLDFWQKSSVGLTEKSARSLLEKLMQLAAMPAELSGEAGEIQKLLESFSDSLVPDHKFWHELALAVQLAFPKETLSTADKLAHQIHQFRYVISAYQAEWVRRCFPGDTDRESLLHYLRTKKRKRFWRRRFDFNLGESSRLHNKLPQSGNDISFPINIKIVMGFHTEFILDSQDCFANELDPRGRKLNGLINGASFNYANRNNRRHRELDIMPVKIHDPLFRRQALANAGNPFYAPKMIYRRGHRLWNMSYLNKKGYYARNGRSLKQEVASFRRTFVKSLKLKK